MEETWDWSSARLEGSTGLTTVAFGEEAICTYGRFGDVLETVPANLRLAARESPASGPHPRTPKCLRYFQVSRRI